MDASRGGAAAEESASTPTSATSSSAASAASLLFFGFMRNLLPPMDRSGDAAAPVSVGSSSSVAPVEERGVSDTQEEGEEEEEEEQQQVEEQESSRGGSVGVSRIDTSDDDAAAAAAPWPIPTRPQQLLRSETMTPKSLKSEEYRQLFHLPPEEMLIEDFNCALQKKILLQGHMYLFDRYVCFYSNIFGYEKKKVIPLKDVTIVRKARTAGVFPNAIEIMAWGKKVSMRASLGELGKDSLKEGDKAPGTAPKGHFFASFLSRDEAFRLIIDGWVQHSRYAKSYLNSQESLASLAASPQSRTSIGENGGTSNNVWQSPLLVTRLEAGRNHENRVEEMAAGIAEPAEGTDHGTAQLVHEQDQGDCLLEDEGTTSNASSFQSPIWELEDLDAPPLGESYKTVMEAEFPVDVEEFFQLFFSDEGIGFAKDFHTKCGDDDFRCTQWAKHRHFGHARDISFRHPINFYFGPKFTYCHEGQRFRVYRNNHLVLETSQQMTDIPYGDYFRVEVRWDVERLFGKGDCHCFVRISLDVSFSKKTMWRSRIEQGTLDESKEAYTTWIQLAKGVLGEMRSMAARHRTRSEPANSIVEGAVEVREAQNGHQMLAGNCEEDFRGEVDDHRDGSCGSLQNSDEVCSMHISSAKSLHLAPVHTEGALEFHSQPEWARKGSNFLENFGMISRRLWHKLSDLKGGGKQLNLVIFMFIAAIIVVMQIGIIITLAWPPKVQLGPAGYHKSVGGNPGTCFGVYNRDETLAWLEQRALHIKEEIAVAEVRLQNLHEELGALKVHADQYLKHHLQISTEPRTSVA